MTKHLKRAYAQMKTNKEESLIDSSINEHFKEVNCIEWAVAKQAEYDVLYPSFREPTENEMDSEYEEYLESLQDGEEDIEREEYQFSDIAIEYTFCEWVEPVMEKGHYSEDGTYIVDEVAVDGYYTPDACTPTYAQWLGDEKCPEYNTESDVAEFKSNDSEYHSYCVGYLSSTDWVVTRKVETGVDIPLDIAEKRERMRGII